jgi:hypothetical protein
MRQKGKRILFLQINGKAYWTKLDKPVANYNKSKKIMKDGQPDGWGDEWMIEVANLSADTKRSLKDAGLLGLVRNKLDAREDFITFRLSTEKRDGTPNETPKVVDENEKPWDWEKRGKIGNDSEVAAKFNVWKNPSSNKASAFLVAVKVIKQVPYEAPTSTTDYENLDDWGGRPSLDDEIPF